MYDRAAACLSWDNNEYYDNFSQMLTGTSEAVWGCVRAKPLWELADSQNVANCMTFWQETTKDLSRNHTDVQGIVIEHMKREVLRELPTIIWLFCVIL